MADRQAQQLRDMQAQQAAILQEQRDNAAALERGYKEQAQALATSTSNRVAEINRQSAAEVERVNRESAIRVRNLNTTNDAITSSLRILGRGMADPGPSAQQSKRSERTRGAKNTSTGLRMGSQVNTAGANLSI